MRGGKYFKSYRWYPAGKQTHSFDHSGVTDNKSLDQYTIFMLNVFSTLFFSFTEQLVLGIVLYLIPITPVSWRAALMPLHVYSGLLIFTGVIAVALMGITEKLIFGL